MPARSTPGPLLGLALRCLIRSGKGKGAAQTCWAPCNHSAPHHGPGQVPVRWATAATGSCSRLQNTPSAAHPGLLVAVPALVPAHCAVPPGLLRRAHRRPSPLRLPLLSLGLSSLALFLFFSPLPIASLSFLSTTAIYRANRLQAGQSLFFGIACQALSHSFLRAASANQQLQSFIVSARPVGIAFVFYPLFLVSWSFLDERRSTKLFGQLSLVRGFFFSFGKRSYQSV